MSFDITGTIAEVFETKQVSDKFSKREFVLEVEDGKYPQLVLFEVTGKTIESLDSISKGAKVRVTFAIRGREWRSPKGETKYFNSLNAWKVEIVGAQPAQTAPMHNTTSSSAADPPPYSAGMDENDIPF